MMDYWPQITMILMYVYVLGKNIAQDGMPTNESYSFSIAFIGVMIGAIILYNGGFFDVFLNSAISWQH